MARTTFWVEWDPIFFFCGEQCNLMQIETMHFFHFKYSLSPSGDRIRFFGLTASEASLPILERTWISLKLTHYFIIFSLNKTYSEEAIVHVFHKIFSSKTGIFSLIHIFFLVFPSIDRMNSKGLGRIVGWADGIQCVPEIEWNTNPTYAE